MSTVSPQQSPLEIVKAKFDFSVDKFPLTGPEGLSTNGLYGLFTSEGQFVGRPCKKNYVPHTTEDVVALTEAAQTAFNTDIDVNCHFKDGHYVDIKPNTTERKAIYGSKDNIFPRVLINASYDGRSFSASIGYWRDLCNNMAMMDKVSGTTVKIRHSSNLRAKMDDLIMQFNRLKEGWNTLSEVAERLEATEVNLISFLDSVYGQPEEDSKRAKTIHENRTTAIFNRLNRERMQSGRPQIVVDGVNKVCNVSAFEAYNLVQGYAQHDQSRHGSPSELSRIISASKDIAVNKALSLVLAT